MIVINIDGGTDIGRRCNIWHKLGVVKEYYNEGLKIENQQLVLFKKWK